MLPACDTDDELTQMPLVSRCRKLPTDLVGKTLTKFQRPLPHRLMADQDASSLEQLLDHAQDRRKPEVQLYGMADHFSWEAVVRVARMTGVLHPSPLTSSGHLLVNLLMPK
jgi:GH35 family endo-1,4-beta-xylanase